MTYPITPFIGPASPPQSPATASYALHPLFPHQDSVCEPFNLERIRIGGEAQYAKQVMAIIERNYKSDPVIANYFDFIFAYSKNFNIFIGPIHSTIPGYTANGHYVGEAETLRVNIQEYDRRIMDKLDSTIRHELRHAFWYAIQKYLFRVTTYPISSYCFDSLIKGDRERVADYIKQGERRVEELKELLLRERRDPQSLHSQEKKWLKSLRQRCKKNSSLYPCQAEVLLSPEDAANFKLVTGEIYQFDDSDHTLVDQAKLIDQIHAGSNVTMIVGILDPLRGLFNTIRDIRQKVNAYPKEQWEQEYEAYLYGDVPPSLLKEFFPELTKYTDEITRTVMEYPEPHITNLNQLAYQSLNDLSLRTLSQRMEDERLLLDYITTYKDVFLHQIEQIIASDVFYKSMGFDKIDFSLRFMINRGIEVQKGNLLLAKLLIRHKRNSNNDSDKLNACRYYYRAFKQGADFTFEDYKNCLNHLIENNQWGDAKVVCQKVSAEYQKKFDKIPLSQAQSRYWFQKNYLDVLEDFRERIHQLRRS